MGGDKGVTFRAGSGGSGDGVGLSEVLGLRLKHFNSILSIHRFNLAVGEAAAENIAPSLWIVGESDRARLLELMSADRCTLTNASWSDAAEMKYANGSVSTFSVK